MNDLIVTVVCNVHGGLLVRWFSDLGQAENNKPMVSADRYGVKVPGYLHAVPVEVLAQAHEVADLLMSGRDPESAYLLATHARPDPRGRLEPIAQNGADHA